MRAVLCSRGPQPPPPDFKASNQGGSFGEGWFGGGGGGGMGQWWLGRRQLLSRMDVIYWPTLNPLPPCTLPVTLIDLVLIRPPTDSCPPPPPVFISHCTLCKKSLLRPA